MKHCDKYQEMISAYIDNELSLVDKNEFEAHISECDKCREELHITRQMVELCHDMEEELPADFSKELSKKLDDAHAQVYKNGRKPIMRYMRTVSTIAACLIIVATLGFASRFAFQGMGAKTDESAPETQMRAMGSTKALDQSQNEIKAEAEEPKLSIQFSEPVDDGENQKMMEYKMEYNDSIKLTFTDDRGMNDTIVRIRTSDVEGTIKKIAGIYEMYYEKGKKSEEILDPGTMVSEIKGITVKTPYSKIIMVPLDKVDDFLDDLTKTYDKMTIDSIPAKDIENPGLIHILIDKEADDGSK